jgi:hypothetical protein
MPLVMHVGSSRSRRSLQLAASALVPPPLPVLATPAARGALPALGLPPALGLLALRHFLASGLLGFGLHHQVAYRGILIVLALCHAWT